MYLSIESILFLWPMKSDRCKGVTWRCDRAGAVRRAAGHAAAAVGPRRLLVTCGRNERAFRLISIFAGWGPRPWARAWAGDSAGEGQVTGSPRCACRAPSREPQRERGVNCHVTLASHQSAWPVSCIPPISAHSGKKLSPLSL